MQIDYRMTPAATVYREKLLLRTREDIPSEAEALPGFLFRLAKRDMPQMGQSEASGKLFVKGMMHLLAFALTKFRGGESADFQFVSLVQLSITETEFRFSFDCPYPAIVQFMQEPQLAERPSLESLGSLTDMSMKYDFALPNEIRLPVVFVYQPAKSFLHIANQNHFSNPSYFLEPEHCRTTSGLLNFIGTLLLLEQMSDQKSEYAHIRKILAQAENVLNSNLDEWLRWLYCLVDTSALFDQKRILVDPENPEKYYYDYSCA